jgi:hypothetical protein
MGKREKWEVEIRQEGLRAMQPARITERYALPQSFVIDALSLEDPDLRAVIEASVRDDGKVITKEIRIQTESRRGLGTRTLQSLPVRELIAYAATKLLGRIEPTTDGWKVTPVKRMTEEAADAIEQAVGYQGVREREY